MRFLASIALFAAALPAFASDAAPAGSITEAQASQQAIVAKLRSDDYEHVSRRHRQKIADLQEALAAVPADGGAAELDRARALVADIDGVMEDAELDRQVCTRERQTGSNRVTRVCRTKREIAEAAQRVRDNGALRTASGCGMEVCPGG